MTVVVSTAPGLIPFTCQIAQLLIRSQNFTLTGLRPQVFTSAARCYPLPSRSSTDTRRRWVTVP